jgi:methionine synthase I (cobalamin-dependent)
MTPSELDARLAAGPLLLDGGLGSLLIAWGLPQGHSPVRWNLERPDRVREAHRLYARAGSDVVHTNTFGANAPKLAAADLEGRCREVNTAGVRLAREGCEGTRCLVAGDIGPSGVHLPPLGSATPAELDAAFAEQVEALVEAGVELLSIETMYDRREALAALRACLPSNLPVLVSMTFEQKKRGFFSIMGDALGPTLAELSAAGANAVGMNCSVTSEIMMAMVREAAVATQAPISAQPNAGQPRATPEGVVYDADPDAFARDLVAMVGAGARLVGGCCGSDPEFIRRTRLLLDF